MVTGSTGRAASAQPFRARTAVIAVGIAVATLLLVSFAAIAAQPDGRVGAITINAVIGTAALAIALNALTSGTPQRVVRTAFGFIISGALVAVVTLGAPPFASTVIGLFAATLLLTIRQWVSETSATETRSALGVFVGAALLLGITLSLADAVTAAPWHDATVASIAGADIAIAALFAAGRSGTEAAGYALRAAAGVATVAACSVALLVIVNHQFGATLKVGALVLLALGDVALLLRIAAARDESHLLGRASLVAAVGAAALATLAMAPAAPAGSLPLLLAAVATGVIAAALRTASKWLDNSSWEGLLWIGAMVLGIIFVDLTILFSWNFLPENGVSATRKLLGVFDIGAILMLSARWMPGRLGYFARRLVLGVITILVVTFVVFALLNFLPSGEKWWSHIVFAKNNTPQRSAQLMHLLGVDQPLVVQYFAWLDSLLQWPPDLGFSNNLHESVGTAIGSRVGATMLLMGASYVVQLLIAIPLGIIAAVKQYSKLDNFVTATAFVGISLPNFWFGTMLIFFFAVWPVENGHSLIFPPGGQFTDAANPSIPDLMWHLVLPVIVLAVQGIAGYMRFVRSSMLDVLSQDFIRTAKAKGLSPLRVIVRHAFRNSLLPLITLMGIDLPTLFVGAVITENVFNWPGMGQLSVQEVNAADVTVVIGILLILAVLVVIGNLIADLFYTVADPRIKFDEA